jgi:hypothetical protein
MKKISYKDWHIPVSKGEMTLKEAHEDLSRLGAKQEGIPLMIQLVENPKYDIPGFDIFHGAVDLATHDYIHIILGRGLLSIDEAFVIGFTMGSTNKVTTTEEKLYSFISKYLYPKVYRFSDEDLQVFRDAVKLGYISDCLPLDQVKYQKYLARSLKDIRKDLKIEEDLILAYYNIENRRYPNSKASQRLLH